jgi:hypothetical protein
MNNYYTYAYLREDGTPYYIGKGTGNRIGTKDNHCVNIPEKNKRIFLKQNLTEEEAFRHEKYMIAILGRKDLGTGILRNLTDGGEGVSGLKHSKETRQKMSASKQNMSEETKQKIRDNIKAKWNNGEYDRENYSKRERNKKHSEEVKNKISASLSKHYKSNKKPNITEEQKKQISETLKNLHKMRKIKCNFPSLKVKTRSQVKY